MTKTGIPISFRFDLHKAVHAAGVLAADNPNNTISPERMLTFLYIADREALMDIGRTITGDKFVVTTGGPSLGEVRELMRSPNGIVKDFFEFAGAHLKLIKSPDDGQLNRYELNKLHEISERYRNLNDEQVADSARAFPEVRKHELNGPSESIAVEDVLEALGIADQIEYVRQNAEMKKAAADLWNK